MIAHRIERGELNPARENIALMLQAPAFDMQWRPEFDVTKAFNPLSLLLPGDWIATPESTDAARAT